MRFYAYISMLEINGYHHRVQHRFLHQNGYLNVCYGKKILGCHITNAFLRLNKHAREKR